MTLLRNFDFAIKYFDYKSKVEFENNLNPKINGWYKFIDATLSALLVKDFDIYFLYNEKKLLIDETYKVLTNKISNRECEFQLLKGNDIVVKYLYQLNDSKFDISPFEYLNEEDFKWENFIAKVINDKECQKKFIANLMTDN